MQWKQKYFFILTAHTFNLKKAKYSKEEILDRYDGYEIIELDTEVS